jgi:hypothetical protein
VAVPSQIIPIIVGEIVDFHQRPDCSAIIARIIWSALRGDIRRGCDRFAPCASSLDGVLLQCVNSSAMKLDQTRPPISSSRFPDAHGTGRKSDG